jgi:hypothetical protein
MQLSRKPEREKIIKLVDYLGLLNSLARPAWHNKMLVAKLVVHSTGKIPLTPLVLFFAYTAQSSAFDVSRGLAGLSKVIFVKFEIISHLSLTYAFCSATVAVELKSFLQLYTIQCVLR